MMASHRPTEPAPLEQPITPTQPKIIPAPNMLTTLPPSGVVAGMDWVLGLGVLVLAFLVASFSVRNSDFFLHLATGRLLSEGGYSFGKDPFSYVGDDRLWVNHAWLFDWILFKLHSAAGGPGVVIAKAILIALSAGMLIVARKAGQSVFPGIVCVGLAIVAAGPRFFLQPTIASLLAISILLALLIRMPKPGGSWRFPVCVAVLFAFWANLDQWFFLGPAFLLLYIIGQIIKPDEGENLGTLWKALALGILACMLNPHHYRVWMLPPELADQSLAKVLGDDIEMGPLFRGAFSKGSLDFSGERENPTNLYFLIGLLALNVVGFVANWRRMSVGLAMVWAGALALALVHLRAMPFLAFVTAPIAAVNLAMALARITAVPRSDPTVRAFFAIRSVGRGTAIFAVLLLIALSYPGWLHPYAQPPRRWAWEIEPNPSMRQTAEKLHEWRQAGLLPAEARMLNLQPDFAHYAAWYAPGAKTYFDLRLRFHRDEAAAYAALRKHLAPRSSSDKRGDTFDMSGFLRTQGTTYVVTSHARRSWNEAVLGNLLDEGRDPTRGPDWVIWNIDGRAVVLGWTRQGTIPKSSFDRLRFEPLRAAYANAKPLPEAEVKIPLPPQNVWDRYVTAPPLAPPEAEEALLLLRYRDTMVGKIAMQQRQNWVAMHVLGQRCLTPALNIWTLLPFQPQSPVPVLLPPDVDAVAVLAVRAARRAILRSPDHPDGYYYLSRTYPTFSVYQFTQDIEQMVTVGSLARAKARIPDDPEQRRFIGYQQDVYDRLREAHQQAGRLDLWLDQTKANTESMRLETEQLEGDLSRYEGDERKQKQDEVDGRNRRLKEMSKEIDNLEATIRKNNDQYVNVAASLTSALDRASVARRFGLAKEAINELFKAHESLQKQLEAEGAGKKFTTPELALHLAIHAELVELMIYDGRVEEAVKILDTMDDADSLGAMESKDLMREYGKIRQKALGWLNPRNPQPTIFDMNPAARYRSLRQGISLLLGDYKRAGEVQAQVASQTRRELEAYRAEHFPKGTPDTSNIPSQLDLSLEILYRPALAALTYSRREYYRKVENLVALSQALVEQKTRMGLTYLEQGNIGLAATHFRQALEAPEFQTPLPAQRTAKEYLKAIDKAGVSQGGSK